MAIADTITSMQNHTSNAYTMIGYGTDLTGINKNLENLSSTIFEAFIESLRDSTTLYTNLPKISGNGTQITLNDTANAPMRITLNPSALSQDATPTPSSPQDIHTISGDNTIKVEGKNILNVPYKDSVYNKQHLIFDGDTFTYIPNTNQRLQLNATSEYTPVFIPAGTTLTFSYTYNSGTLTVGVINASLGLLYEDGTTVTFPTGDMGVVTYKNTVNVTKTLEKNVKSMRMYIQGYGATITDNLVYKGQLEYGNQATTYEPYVSNTQTISLGNIEYCKIGDYEDRIFKNVSGDTDYSSEREEGKWYLKKNIGKVVLDGSESWYTNASTFRFSGFNGKPFTTFDENNPLAYSNYFKWQNGKSNQFVYGSMWYTLDGTQFAIQKEATVTQATLADFKTWLSSNNLSVYYVLATPTYTQITGTLETQLENIYKNMLSYKGTTNVSQINNDLPFVLGVSAIQDLE